MYEILFKPASLVIHSEWLKTQIQNTHKRSKQDGKYEDT